MMSPRLLASSPPRLLVSWWFRGAPESFASGFLRRARVKTVALLQTSDVGQRQEVNNLLAAGARARDAG